MKNRGQYGRPHRQAERARDRPLLRPRPAGNRQQAVPRRAGAARQWNSCDGGPMNEPIKSFDVESVISVRWGRNSFVYCSGLVVC